MSDRVKVYIVARISLTVLHLCLCELANLLKLRRRDIPLT
jgi:hypothetical protein